MRLFRNFVAALFLVAICASAFASGKASFGFGTGVKTSGFFLNPTLERVWVSRIEPGSPAQKAGLLVGDILVSANGKILEGAPAKDMASFMRSLEPGDHLKLVVQRSGKEVQIDIVAGSR